MEYHIFKGGVTNGGSLDLRKVPNQRPADGHIKPDGYENFLLFSTEELKREGYKLEVGDQIAIFTTLTLGYVTGLGARVVSADSGVKFKLVSQEGNDISVIKVKKSLWDTDAKDFADAEDLDWAAIEDLGSEEAYFSGSTEKLNEFYSQRTDLIMLEVVEVPENGIYNEVCIEFRIHQQQPVRPPAQLCC